MPDFSTLPPGMELIEVQRHARKLQRGALTGNRFEIVLRACEGDRDRLLQRVADIAKQGVPNYFGEQRFGRDDGNVARAREMFLGAPVQDRHLRGVYLSAARSWIFNEILAQRVRDGTWQRHCAGEVFILNGSNSFFVAAESDADLPRRLAEGDIHPSGALWGHGDLPSRGDVRALEEGVARQEPVLTRGLEQADLDQQRRALRLLVGELTAHWQDHTTLKLAFSLPSGCYATTILRELACYTDVGGK